MTGRKSRQLVDNDIHEGKLPNAYSYCRVCQSIKTEQFFGKAVDLELDVNGKMSVCKSCIDILFSRILVAESNSIERATLVMCRKLNVKFDKQAIDAALVHIQTKQSDPTKFFNLYRAKVLVTSRSSVKDDSFSVDLTYQFNDEEKIVIDESKFLDNDVLDMEELRKFWGRGLEPEEIMILEEKFSNYSKTNAIDTQPERVLLKYICLKEYEIDKEMESKGGKKSIANLTKDYESLLKTAGIAPSSANAGSGGKSMDAFGVWLADIMQFRPEEWVEDKSIYKDVDNIEEYNERIFVSPLRTFTTGSREFSVDADEIVEEEVEGE